MAHFGSGATLDQLAELKDHVNKMTDPQGTTRMEGGTVDSERGGRRCWQIKEKVFTCRECFHSFGYLVSEPPFSESR